MEFDTAIEESQHPEDEQPPTPIHIDKGNKQYERTIHAHRPSEGQFALLMRAMGKGSTGGDMLAGAVDFFLGLLDEEDEQYIVKRLLNRKDPFSKKGAEHIQKMLEDLVETWGGHPTQSLSVSTQSPESDGQKSTPPTPELTSSESPFVSS